MDCSRIPASVLLLLLLLNYSVTVSADDAATSFLEDIYYAIKAGVDGTINFFFTLFPGLKESLHNLFFWEPEEKHLSWVISLRALFWFSYIAFFFVVIVFLLDLWNMSNKYFYNALGGIIILLFCIHALEMELEFSILNSLIVLFLGVPGAFIILLLHFLGVHV